MVNEIKDQSGGENNTDPKLNREDTQEEDRIIIRRHSWQHAGKDLLVAEDTFPPTRPKSNVDKIETFHHYICTTAHVCKVPEAIHGCLEPTNKEPSLEVFDELHHCRIAEDILIDVVENAISKVAATNHFNIRIDAKDRLNRKEELVLRAATSHQTVPDHDSDNEVISMTDTIEEMVEQDNSLNVSFGANEISEIIDEIIDLTIKEPKLCHVSVSKITNCMENMNTNTEFGPEKSNLIDYDDSVIIKQSNDEEEIRPNLSIAGSVIDHIGFNTILLQEGSNQSLEPRAISATHQILANTQSSILAIHLTKVDCNLFFSSTFKMNKLAMLKCQSELKKHPDDDDEVDDDEVRKNFLADVLERCACLKTFVVVTILTAMNVAESAKICSKWIQVALQLKQKIGNLFGFFNILSGLTANQLLRWGDLWICLREVCVSCNIILPS